jgi:hypothetical protein
VTPWFDGSFQPLQPVEVCSAVDLIGTPKRVPLFQPRLRPSALLKSGRSGPAHPGKAEADTDLNKPEPKRSITT